ncbi:ABC transporter permease [Geodermatophilus sabuli]|uniref:Transport permease protein n=1 Tax=Geodermatophilus sabuli TaxID=1564158 RepID=A0A285EJR0_9ACTN|nr:ABC transporter permease [Geodermatophilus sabuli]MBB3086983.1 ABC-2 type transport system permease protein [Geodermatophilus sabuli]SNX99237.1 ABC-2 type transport system permease protein [Geodermatophilus sabuli]
MTTRETAVTATPAPAPLGEVRSDLAHELRATWVVMRRELTRLRQDRARMLTMLLQPVLFIFVMGTGLASIVDTGGDVSFQTFLFPGVLATSVLFTAAFAGISLVWDREFGFLREMMVAPISRSAIIWGKCLGGAVVATAQSLVLLALVGTVGIPYSPTLLLALVGCLFLGSLLLTALGVLLSTRIKTIQTAMPVSQLLIMPMMFLSGALFPVSGLPDWLAVLTRLNPLTYVVQPMRHLTLSHLSLTAEEQQRLLPVLTWWGWEVPVGVQLLTVAVITLGLVTLAARVFRTTE